MRDSLRLARLFVFLILFTQPLFAAQVPGGFGFPVFRQSLGTQTFDRDTQGWTAETRVRLRQENQALYVEAVGKDPMFYRLYQLNCTQMHLRMKVRTREKATCEIYWLTSELAQRDPRRKIEFVLDPDYNWHDYEAVLPISGHLTALSVKILAEKGSWEFDDITITAMVPYPLRVQNVVRESGSVVYTLVNTSQYAQTFTEEATVGEQNVPANSSLDLRLPLTQYGPISVSNLRLKIPGFPVIKRTLHFHEPNVAVDWITRPIVPHSATNAAADSGGPWTLEVSSDARVARIVRPSAIESVPEVLALFAPLVCCDGVVPEFRQENHSVPGYEDDSVLHFVADEGTLTLLLQGSELRYHFEPTLEPNPEPTIQETTGPEVEETVSEADSSDAQIIAEEPKFAEGPILRIPGPLEGGLLCGTEFLSRGGSSSSEIDIQPPNNLRDTPMKQWITFPLGALASDKICVAMLWNDPQLQPTFSSPNRFDLSDDSRLSLRGGTIEAVLRFSEVQSAGETPALPGTLDPITDAILWGVQQRELPELPTAPRTPQEQKELCLAAYEGPLLGVDKMSWGYDVDATTRQPYADVLSTLYRLTDEVPRISGITPDGGVITNDAIYFLANRVQEWKEVRGNDVRNALAEMNPNGSFIRRSLYPELETIPLYGNLVERAADAPNLSTAGDASLLFGYSARKAAFLLDYAQTTGDASVLESAEKTLTFLSGHTVPRGGFYWESPLHSPDILSAAYATWAFCRAFELTQKPEYLAEAKRFAISGLPFVYLWDNFSCLENAPEGALRAGNVADIGTDYTVKATASGAMIIRTVENAAPAQTQPQPAWRYATVPMFGASYRERSWFGVAQPWSGTVYGYALTLLAKHDQTLDWNRIATGILIAAEQMQYADGPYAGCVPDAFDLETQVRQMLKLNPSCLVSLRCAVEGQVDSLSVIRHGTDTVASPFRIQANRRGALIRSAPARLKFEILINGQRIQPVEGSGSGRDQVVF